MKIIFFLLFSIPAIAKTEIVTSYSDMLKGLSGRESISPKDKMIFDYGSSAIRCHWGVGLKFPVLTTFVKENKKISGKEIINIGQTEPLCSKEPVRYVIEQSVINVLPIKN